MVRIRICHVTNAGGSGRLQRGGAERGVRELLRALDRRKYALSLVCPAGARDWFDGVDGLEIIELAPQRRVDLHYLFALDRLFRSRSFDIVHVHLLSAAVHGRIAARLAHVPVVVSDLHNSLEALHEAQPHRAQRRFRHALYAMLDRVLANHATTVCIAISAAVRDAMVRQGIEPDRIRLIHNWVDERQFRPLSRARRQRVREALGLDKAAVIAAVGRLEQGKGFDLLLDALSHVAGDWTLIVCGEGAERAELEHRACMLGIGSRIRWLGYRRDVHRIMAAADVVCVPSRVDGFGRVGVEALAVGTPVIANAVDGLSYVLHGVPGARLVDGDSDALAAALADVVAGDVPRSISGATAVRRCFSLEAAVSHYELLYDSLATPSR